MMAQQPYSSAFTHARSRTLWIKPISPCGKSSIIHESSVITSDNKYNSHIRASDDLQVSFVLFKDLGLSGLSTACDPNIKYHRKMFWGCLWLMAVVWTVIEVTSCLVTFASSPYAVTVIYKYNQTISAPYITLCPMDAEFRNPAVSPTLLKARSCDDSYKNVLELFHKCNMTIETLWNISRFEMKDPLCRLFQAVKWIDGFTLQSRKEIEMSELPTIHGICIMFKLNIPLQCTGMQNGIDIEGHTLAPNATVTAAYYAGVIHSEEEIPLIQYTGTMRIGFYAAYRQLTTTALRVQQLIHVNTWKNPCQTDANYAACMLHCIEQKVISNSKLKPCRLPYMNKRLPVPLCNSEDEFSDMYSATQSAVKEVRPQICGCIRPCKKLHYKENYFFSYPVEHLLGLYVIIPQCDIEVIEDQLTYGFTNLLSDIGGTLGLFLGMSILSIIEILEVLFWKLFNFPIRANAKE